VNGITLHYVTVGTSGELAWGLGLGCNDIVRVLLEPLAPPSSYIAALRRSLASQSNIATVFHQLLWIRRMLDLPSQPSI
jgi:xanthine/CO dehydrogenase XdhC/CoxF family maturation factor